MTSKLAAAAMFVAGTAIVAAPIALGLGWALPTAGIMLGVSAGIVAGIIWATARGTPNPTAPAPERWLS
jgi:hypothetical protein